MYSEHRPGAQSPDGFVCVLSVLHRTAGGPWATRASHGTSKWSSSSGTRSAARDWNGMKSLLTEDAHYTDIGVPGPGGTGPMG